MYNDNVLDDDDIEELDLNKERDDFESNCLLFSSKKSMFFFFSFC